MTTIFPTIGYLNTTFQISSDLDTANLCFVDDLTNQELEIIDGKIRGLSAGTHTLHDYVNDITLCVFVNDAWRFGGSVLKYGYLATHSQNAIIVMLDRIYIYNYKDNQMWMENGLVPDEIEDIDKSHLLFSSNHKTSEDKEFKNKKYYSIFSINSKRLIYNFNEILYKCKDYLICKGN